MVPTVASQDAPFLPYFSYFFFCFFFLAFLVIEDGEKLSEKSGIACWNVSEMENFRKLMYKIREILKINEKNRKQIMKQLEQKFKTFLVV